MMFARDPPPQKAGTMGQQRFRPIQRDRPTNCHAFPTPQFESTWPHTKRDSIDPEETIIRPAPERKMMVRRIDRRSPRPVLDWDLAPPG